MENSQNKITAEKRRQYYEKFVDKNKEKVVGELICSVCNQKYTYFNKSRHTKSIKHKYAELLKKQNI
jgi:hypothetical protein